MIPLVLMSSKISQSLLNTRSRTPHWIRQSTTHVKEMRRVQTGSFFVRPRQTPYRKRPMLTSENSA